TSEFLVNKCSFSPETVSKVVSLVPRLRNADESESLLSFLRGNGFSNSQLQELLKSRPKVLTSNLETNVKPKVEYFRDLCISNEELVDVILNDPWVLRHSLNRIICTVSVLKEIVKSDSEVIKLLKKCPWFLSKDLKTTLLPNVEFLMSCGIQLEQIVRYMYHNPRFFLNPPHVMRNSVDKADEMGVKRNGKMLIHAARVYTLSEEKWESKLQTFRNMGFTEADISNAFRRVPVVFLISSGKMVKVKDVLLATGKYDVSGIAKYPTILCCSIEKWHKPRIRVLQILESKNLIERWPSISSLIRMSNKKFAERYVIPFTESVGNV
ncbi:hypothetical protein M569_04106, partial [Genlisea aurea]